MIRKAKQDMFTAREAPWKNSILVFKMPFLQGVYPDASRRAVAGF
jgi:hypothetical protein